MFTSVAELEATCLSGDDHDRENHGSNPTCVLASGATLDHGPARDLFLKWSENADNTIIITDFRQCVQRGIVVHNKEMNRMVLHPSQPSSLFSSEREGNRSNIHVHGMRAVSSTSGDGIVVEPIVGAGTETPTMIQEEESVGAINVGTALTTEQVSEYCTSAQLLLKWCEAKASGEEMEDVVECDVPVPKRAPLAGSELKAFLKQEEAKRLKEQAAEERRAMLREVELAKGRLRLNEEDPGGTNSTMKASDKSTVGDMTKEGQQRDALARPKKKSRFDAELFLKFSKPCHCKLLDSVKRDEWSVFYHVISTY
jgi:cleavage and polyadenylation specificity factor subunit 2